MFTTTEFYVSPIALKDAWSICNFVHTNEDRLKKFFPQTLAQNINPQLAELFAAKKVKEWEQKKEFLFTLKDSENHKIIGLVYLKEIYWDRNQAELAYAIDYNFEGKGYIKKTVEEICRYSFEALGLKTLQIIVHHSNTASVRVAAKCGFKPIKTLANAHTPPNKIPMNMELYELYAPQE